MRADLPRNQTETRERPSRGEKTARDSPPHSWFLRHALGYLRRFLEVAAGRNSWDIPPSARRLGLHVGRVSFMVCKGETPWSDVTCLLGDRPFRPKWKGPATGTPWSAAMQKNAFMLAAALHRRRDYVLHAAASAVVPQDEELDMQDLTGRGPWGQSPNLRVPSGSNLQGRCPGRSRPPGQDG